MGAASFVFVFLLILFLRISEAEDLDNARRNCVGPDYDELQRDVSENFCIEAVFKPEAHEVVLTTFDGALFFSLICWFAGIFVFSIVFFLFCFKP